MKTWKVRAWSSTDKKHSFCAAIVKANSKKEALKVVNDRIENQFISDMQFWNAGPGHIKTVSRFQG